MRRERYSGEYEGQEEGPTTSHAADEIRRAKRSYDFLKPESTPATPRDSSLGSVNELEEASVEMFPQEGIVVGPDTNSDKAVQTFKDYADALFAIEDARPQGLGEVFVGSSSGGELRGLRVGGRSNNRRSFAEDDYRLADLPTSPAASESDPEVK